MSWPAFTALLPRRILDDDDARLEIAADFAFCAAVMNTPTDRLFPDQDDEDE